MKKLSVCAIIAFTASLPLAGSVLANDPAGQGAVGAGAGAAAGRTTISSDFNSFDKDGDKKISQEEASNNTIIEYFVAIDQDSDQQITEQEFVAFTERYPSLVNGGAAGEMEEAE